MTNEDTHKYTISFPESLWQNLIEVAGLGNVKQFIIQALKVSLEGHVVKACILAGGKGTGFRPISVSTPAVMHPIGYKPIISYTMDLLKKYSITNVVFAVGYLKEHIQKHFNSINLADMSITFISEEEQLDTAGAILNAKNEFRSTFIILNGDVITNLNLRSFLEFHHLVTVKNGGIASMFILENEGGQVNFDSSSLKITDFVSKEDKTLKHLNGGLYILEPDIFSYIKNPISSLENDTFPELAKNGKLFGYLPENADHVYWNHVNNLEHYNNGWADFLAGKLNF